MQDFPVPFVPLPPRLLLLTRPNLSSIPTVDDQAADQGHETEQQAMVWVYLNAEWTGAA